MAGQRPDRFGGGLAATALAAALVGWITATTASQHPNRAFDRLRRFDKPGILLPTYRFFAPEPAQHDFHLLHRVVDADGGISPWVETREITERRWVQAVWFPDRRRDKALYDMCAELVAVLGSDGADVPASTPYKMIRDSVELTVRDGARGQRLPTGFQFVIARGGGYDDSVEPDYLMVSPLVRLAG